MPKNSYYQSFDFSPKKILYEDEAPFEDEKISYEDEAPFEDETFLITLILDVLEDVLCCGSRKPGHELERPGDFQAEA